MKTSLPRMMKLAVTSLLLAFSFVVADRAVAFPSRGGSCTACHTSPGGSLSALPDPLVIQPGSSNSLTFDVTDLGGSENTSISVQGLDNPTLEAAVDNAAWTFVDGDDGKSYISDNITSLGTYPLSVSIGASAVSGDYPIVVMYAGDGLRGTEIGFTLRVSSGPDFPAFVQTDTFSNLGWGVNTTRGWRFTVNEEIQVEELGFWDSGLDGLSQPHPVGIWRDADQALLTTATVPDSTAAPLEGTFRWVSTEPVTLTPGNTYVIGAYWLSGSPDTRLGLGENTVFDSRVTVTGGRGINTTGLSFPPPAVNIELNANFRAVVAPIPTIITNASLEGTTFTLVFTGEAGLIDWKVKGASQPHGFADDWTGNSTISETSPGIYQAIVELGSLNNEYFLRIER